MRSFAGQEVMPLLSYLCINQDEWRTTQHTGRQILKGGDIEDCGKKIHQWRGHERREAQSEQGQPNLHAGLFI